MNERKKLVLQELWKPSCALLELVLAIEHIPLGIELKKVGWRMEIRVGDVVEFRSNLSERHHGRVLQVMEIIPHVYRYKVQQDPIVNCVGQTFELPTLNMYAGQLRKVSDLELLAMAG